MPTITRKVNPRNQVGATPWGNSHKLQYPLRTAANGGAIDADSSAPIAIGDKVRLGRIPAGSLLADSLMVISTAFTAAVTANIGFEYIDGVDSTAVPQDDDYFAAAAVLSSAALLRKTTPTMPVTLPKDAWLIATFAGANNAKVARLDMVLSLASEGVA